MPELAFVTPLVHVFPSVVYLQALENDPSLEQNLDASLQELHRNGQLKLIAPAPLGEDRDRFLSLIQDVATRRDDYLNQLAALRLANGGQSALGESSNAIISQLNPNADKKDDEHRELLWHARLLLKLGELFDREQQEIKAQLAAMDAKESALFKELREETDSSFSLTQDIFQAQGKSDNLMPHRLKAWSQIYCLGNQELSPDLTVFITDQVETVERIRDAQVEDFVTETMKSVSLTLPAYAEGNALNCNELKALTADICVERLCTALVDENTTQNQCQELAQTLQLILDTRKTGPGRGVRLDLYPFSKHHSTRLFGESFLSGEKFERGSSNTEHHTILGVLNS